MQGCDDSVLRASQSPHVRRITQDFLKVNKLSLLHVAQISFPGFKAIGCRYYTQKRRTQMILHTATQKLFAKNWYLPVTSKPRLRIRSHEKRNDGFQEVRSFGPGASDAQWIVRSSVGQV